MNERYKLIHTSDNSFIVDVETEIVKGDWRYDESPERGFHHIEKHCENTPYLGGGYYKIIASLNKIDDSIPLFDLPVEDDVNSIIKNIVGIDYFNKLNKHGSEYKTMVAIYNQSKSTKGYSKEDLRKAFVAGRKIIPDGVRDFSYLWDEDEYIQSLNQPKELQIESIETEEVFFTNANNSEDIIKSEGLHDVTFKLPKLVNGKIQVKWKNQ